MIRQWTPETEPTAIGGGTYGEVFRVIDRQSRYNRPAVVKRLFSTTNVYAQNDEYEAMKRLSGNKRHKHIVELFELTITNEASRKQLGFVMEFCDGGTLSELITDSTVVYSMKTVVFWAIQLFKAIRYLFYHRILHGDIKPNNIFVKKIQRRSESIPYTMKLGDFGQSRRREGAPSTISNLTAYGPPLLNDEDDQGSHKHDVYGIGLIVWELIERRHIFSEFIFKNQQDNSDFWDRDTFMQWVTDRKFILEPPSCHKHFKEIQQLINRCASFTLSRRPTAVDCVTILRGVLSGNSEEGKLLRSLELFPKKEKTLKEPIKPMGFNESKRDINSLIVNPLSLKKARRPTVYKKKFLNIMNSITSRQFLGTHLGTLENIEQKFTCLLDDTNPKLYENFWKEVAIRKHNYYKYHDMIRIRSSWNQKSKMESLETGIPGNETEINMILTHLCGLLILNDICVLIEEFFYSSFTFLECPVFDRPELEVHIPQLKAFKEGRITTEIYFRCYSHTSTLEKWLSIDEDKQRFVKEDLSEIRIFQGKWKDNGGTRHFECDAPDEWLQYQNLEPIDIDKLIKKFTEIFIYENFMKIFEL